MRRFFWIRKYPTVQPGGTITMQMNAEKVKKDAEPKEKKDLESTLSKGLSTILSVVSIIMVARNL